MRARRAAPRAAASSAPFGYSGSASVPTTRISSRSAVTVGGPVNQSSGRRPANQPSRSWRSRALRHDLITSLHRYEMQTGRPRRDATTPPAGGTEGASTVLRDFGGWEGNPCPERTVRRAASRQRDATMPPCGGGGIVERCPIPGGDRGASRQRSNVLIGGAQASTDESDVKAAALRGSRQFRRTCNLSISGRDS